MSSSLNFSFDDLSRVLIKDRFYLKRDLQAFLLLQRKQDEQSRTRALRDAEALNNRFSSSCDQLLKRQSLPLHIEFPEELPISQRLDDIAQLIHQHPVVIVAGETGSGKTTQLSKLCLQLGRGRAGMIAHTQPRRVAASSVAARISEELKVQLGEQVGYQVRFTDHSGPSTLLKLMTDGVLLAEIQHDRFLQKYDTIIIDEAHERSLNIDFLLGFLKTLLPNRPDLKVIVTSATIDVARFSAHFHDAPVITVSGRSYPVDVLYRPIEASDDEQPLAQAVLSTIEEIVHDEQIHHADKGDVLVFLPGEHAIREISLLLRRAELPSTEILPLYSRLSVAEHQKIFQLNSKKAGRRVILATNVAETSLTVPGIRYVIDSGLARMSRYSHRTKVQRLPIEKISQASASQRAGRCGRVAAGICFRLYSEEDFSQREEFTQPEIQRTNLAAVILQMQLMRLGDIDDFPFIEMPDSRLINDGFKQLFELGAIDSSRKITHLGKQLGHFPIDPRFAAMLVKAHQLRSLKEMLIVVAALSIQDPRESPSDKREASREKHQRFADIDSDFISLLKLWDYVEEQRQTLSRQVFAKQMSREFLSVQRLREWRETHSQLKRICDRLKLSENTDPADYASLHQSLLSGLLTHIGVQRDNKAFEGTRSRQFKVFPASSLAKKPPKWLMAADLLETSQLFAHLVAKIDPEWVLTLAPHLIKHHYSEPHWSVKQGQVMAYQRSSLYGLVLNDRKRVSFSKIDAVLSHEIFIRSALVEEQWRSNAPFYLHNRRLKESIHDIEAKSRRKDIAVNDDVVYAFYAAIIPREIVSVDGFESWRKKAERQDPRVLFASEAVFRSCETDFYHEQQFPDTFEWQGVNYIFRYRFEPGQVDDGLTVVVPVATLNRLPRFLFEWLVPGMLAEKCEELIKSLPKQYRRSFVPVPQSVQKLMPLLKMADVSLVSALSAAIKTVYSLQIPQDAWQLEKLDPYYFVNFYMVDDEGQLLEQSRDIAYLIKVHGHKVQQALDQTLLSRQHEKSVHQQWDFGDIEKEKILEQAGTLIHSYPALSDAGEGVVLTLTDYEYVQLSVHRRGLIKLAMLELAQQVKYLRKELLAGNALQLQLVEKFDKPALIADIIDAAFNHTFFNKSLPFKHAEFKHTVSTSSAKLVSNATAIEKLVIEVLVSDFKVRRLLALVQDKKWAANKKDIEQQRAALIYPQFVFNTPIEHLFELPRYFSAMVIRLERMASQLNKDTMHTLELGKFTACMQQLQDQESKVALLPDYVEYRWMLEEYRVSLFAQQLKTKMPISAKRLEKQWQQVLDTKKRTIL